MDDLWADDLAQVLPDAVVVIGAAGEIRWANAAAERMFGMTVDSVRDHSALDLIHPDDLEFALCSIGTVQDKVAGSPIEIRVRAVDGWRLVELIGSPIGGGDIVTCVRDLTERRAFEIAHDEEARFRSLVHNAGAITMLLSADGIVASASAAITRLTGHDQYLVHDTELADLLATDTDREALSAALRDVAPGSMTTALVNLTAHGGPATVPIEFTITNLLDDPTVAGYVLSGHDVSDRVAAEDEVRRTLSLLSATLDSTADGILVVDRTGRITSWNQRFVEMWRIPPELVAARVDDAVLTYVLDQLEDAPAFLRKVEELYAQPGAESYDMLRFGDGRVFERVSLPQRVDGEVMGRVWSFRDLTERKQLEDQLVYRAFHDELTGLANKARFCDRLEHAAERSQRTADQFAVLFLDLDNFKTVNDSLGHHAGDRLLIAAAEILSTALRAGDTAARLGGDEFAVLLEHITEPDRARDVAERVRDAFRRPISIDGREVVSTASIGIAIGGGRSTSDQILRDADLAMYTAKSHGKNRFEFFEPDQHEAAVVRVEVESELHGALERDELRLVYQPIVNIDTNRIVAAEALVRWDHPRRGLLMPDSFVPIAEDAGLMDEVGRGILRQACRQGAEWRAGPAPDLAVSVNVSALQLAGDTLVDDVTQALAASRLNPQGLILEITETAMMRDTGIAKRNLLALEALGVQLALDDFGTGYSSLTHLQQFPISIVKIDKTFVAGIGRALHGPSLPAAIVQLATTLGLRTVAEGVETLEQVAQLRKLGCELVQGFLFYRPLAPADLTDLLLDVTHRAAS